jgi:hypothetical protein
MLPLSSGLKDKPSKKSELAACFMLASCLAYYSTLKMKVTRSSEMPVDFRRTTRRYKPEDNTSLFICPFVKPTAETCDIGSICAWNYWIFGLFPSGVLKNTRERNISEIGSVSVLR